MFNIKSFWGLPLRNGALSTLHTFLVVGLVIMSLKIWYEGLPSMEVGELSWTLIIFIIFILCPFLSIIGVLMKMRQLLFPFMASLLFIIGFFVLFVIDIFLSYKQRPVVLHGLASHFTTMASGVGFFVLILLNFLCFLSIGLLIYDFCGVLSYFQELTPKRRPNIAPGSTISSPSPQVHSPQTNSPQAQPHSPQAQSSQTQSPQAKSSQAESPY